MLATRTAAFSQKSYMRGLTLVELMISIVIGLFITAVTIKVVVDRLSDDRIHIAEIRLNQNLRAAADVIARDLRRAGHWEAALSGLFKNDGTAPVENTYVVIEPKLAELDYSYQRLGAASTTFGFKRFLEGDIGVLKFSENPSDLIAPVWENLTDPDVVNVLSDFSIVAEPREIKLSHFCRCKTLVPPCGNTDEDASDYEDVFAEPPRLLIRQFVIRIPAVSVIDPSIRREFVETVRVRNDELVGSCKLNP